MFGHLLLMVAKFRLYILACGGEKINSTRRKYAVPAGMERHRSADDHAIAIWSGKYWAEVQMQGNALAEEEASQAHRMQSH